MKLKTLVSTIIGICLGIVLCFTINPDNVFAAEVSSNGDSLSYVCTHTGGTVIFANPSGVICEISQPESEAFEKACKENDGYVQEFTDEVACFT